MYRRFALLLLCGVTAAPQDAAITYVKITPQTDAIQTESYTTSRIENIPLTSPTAQEEIGAILETSNDNDSRNSPEPTTELLTETTEAVTERDEARTTVYEVRTKPRFYSKLSYFEKHLEKPDFSPVLTNLVERPARRRFRSRCRCEKISNCPKLQISVPRCPDEQFMCCF